MGIFKKKTSVNNKDVSAEIKESSKGYRIYKKNYFIEERSDTLSEQNKLTATIIYKYSLFTMILTMFFILATIFILVTRDDSKIYASSPDGRIWELETREIPNGSFKIKEYKGE